MISTHILDTTLGLPASNVKVKLEKQKAAAWENIATESTNADGRIVFSCAPEAGTYRLTFQIEEYFKTHKQAHFFQDTQIVFKIMDTNRKYHVPLLLNPYGYSTYRGS